MIRLLLDKTVEHVIPVYFSPVFFEFSGMELPGRLFFPAFSSPDFEDRVNRRAAIRMIMTRMPAAIPPSRYDFFIWIVCVCSCSELSSLSIPGVAAGNDSDVSGFCRVGSFSSVTGGFCWMSEPCPDALGTDLMGEPTMLGSGRRGTSASANSAAV